MSDRCPINFQTIMKRFILAGVVGCLALSARATQDTYTANGLVYSYEIPNIDATSFINYGYFYASSYSTSPYYTYNTRNYTNLNTMYGSSGFRFDTTPYATGSQRSMAANFVNGSLASSNNCSIYGSTFLQVWATNIVNRGLLSVGEYGLISLEGRNVDLLRGAFQVGTFTARTNTRPEAVFDSTWSIGTASISPDRNVVTNFPSTPIYSLTEFIPGGGAANPYGNIQRTQLSLTDTTGGTLTSAEYIREQGTNRSVQIIFLRNLNTNILTEIQCAPNGNQRIAAYALGTPMISWSALGTNAFGQVITNRLYLQDTFGVDAATALLDNYPYSSQPPQSVPIPPATEQPDNYHISRTPPNGFVAGGQTNVPFTDKTQDFWTTNTTTTAVTADYSAYGFRLGTTTTDPYAVTNLRTGPGRIEIKASGKLDLRLARIEGLNYLKLESTNHFVGASGASISAAYSDVSLGSTNGSLDVSGLLNSTLPRLNGTIDCYSTKWSDTVIFNNSTNTVNFHVLFVDADLASTASPGVFDLSLRSTNVSIADSFDVLNNFSLDADRFTIQSTGMLNVSRPDLLWSDSATHLKAFTNLGYFYFPNVTRFVSRNTDGSDRPYNSFVNSGTVYSYGITIASDNIDNSGFLESIYGPIQITASSNVVLRPGSYMWAPYAGATIETANLYVTNQNFQLGHGLTLSVTGSLNSGPNYWQVGDGFNLLQKPVTGDLAETEIYDSGYPYSDVQHTWAGADLGPTAAGFTNNAALGALYLDGGLFTQFTFSGTGPSSNALYVDVLYLLNDATNLDVDGNVIALNLNPGMKIYYGQAFADDGAGGFTNITSDLAGKNGGTLGQVDHTGPLSVVPELTDVALRVAVEKTPSLHTVVTWHSVARATNYLYYVEQPYANNWQLLTNFVSPATGVVTNVDSNLGTSRFYKVKVAVP